MNDGSAFSIESLQRAFDDSVGVGDELDARMLQTVLRLESAYMARRMLELFDLDASLHDVSAVDAELLKANAKSAVDAAAAAFEEDEKARLRREKAEKEGYPGRRKDAEKPDGEDAKDKAKEAPTPAAPEADNEGDGWRSAWAAAGDREGWLDENPLGVPTEREVQTTSTNGRCYRVMLVRNNTTV